jgi:hypothetical protein
MAGAEQLNAMSPTVKHPPASGQAGVPADETTAIATVPVAIPMEDVAVKALEVSSLLNSVSEALAPDPQIESIRDSLVEVRVKIEKATAKSLNILEQKPFLSVIQDQEQHWQLQQRMLTKWFELLQKRSKEFYGNEVILTDLLKIWTTTLKVAEESEVSVESLRLINETIASIHSVRTLLKDQLAPVHDLQSQASREVEQCDIILTKIAKLQQEAVSHILIQNSPPLWSTQWWMEAGRRHSGSISAALSSYVETGSAYLTEFSRQMTLYAGLLGALSLLFLLARNHANSRPDTEPPSPYLSVFEQPLVAALTATLVVATAPYHSPLPLFIRDTLQVLIPVSMIRLIRPFIPNRLIPGLYALGFLFTCDAIRKILFTEQFHSQLLLVLESLAGIAIMIWFLSNFRLIFAGREEPATPPVVRPATILFLLLFTSGLAASVIGYLNFALVITPSILAFGVMAIAMYGIPAGMYRLCLLRIAGLATAAAQAGQTPSQVAGAASV